MVHTTSDATDSLTYLMRQVKFYLEQQRKTPDSHLSILYKYQLANLTDKEH